jgi:hypothetical protein
MLTDSVVMGSPLSPVTASFFIKNFEEMALEGGSDPRNHVNIQFTMETENDGHLPFLDIDTYRKLCSPVGHKVYRKPTHTNLYLNSNSHHHPSNKEAVQGQIPL